MTEQLTIDRRSRRKKVTGQKEDDDYADSSLQGHAAGIGSHASSGRKDDDNKDDDENETTKWDTR